jgi:cytoskeletal protein CcmA (bactofilin family)
VGEGRFGRRPAFWLSAIGLLVIVGAGVAIAQESRLGGKVRAADEVVVLAGETVDGDLYAAGGLVRIEGTVSGDLVAVAGQVQVSGEVTGDVLAGSGNVDVSGDVGGDVRVGAGQVSISGTVGEDVSAGAGQVTVTSSGRVGEDLIFGTGQTTLDGRVDGDVLGATGNYRRRGTVGGTEDVTVAREKRAPTVQDRLLAALGRFVSILIVGALLLWLAPRIVDGAAQQLRRRPLASLGVGVLGVLGLVVLVLGLLLVTVLLAIGLGLVRLGDLIGLTIFGTGTLLTILGFLFYVVAAFAAHATVGLALGRLAVGASPGARRWGAFFLGVLIVVLITSVPVVGGWLAFLFVVSGLGALILEFWPRRRAPQPAEAARQQ